MPMEKKNIDPEIDPKDEDEDTSLPDLPDESAIDLEVAADAAPGRDVVAEFARHAPLAPGVYRMIGTGGEVLYVGKAKSIKKRILSYARGAGLETRIARMVAATTSIEFVTTATETEALLLEANMIKRLRPRFNVLLRDDKSFPYILITRGDKAAQICKHRGARNRDGDYYGPFAAVNAVNRTITALERAFLIRSCSDTVFESRTRPCLLFQIKRCSGPCTGEIARADYDELVREAKAFLSGKSRAVKEELAREMDEAAEALDFERAAALRDRLAAFSAVQARQGINPRGVEEADVFAIHQDGGFNCIEVFFFRTGQNWGNRAYFPRADRALGPGEVLGAFLAQFYDDKPCPRLILLSHDIEERALLSEALSIKSGRKVEISVPVRGEKRDLVEHALANAREALGRKLAEAASQQRLLAALATSFSLPHPPRRIEVYDNSHIQGTNAVGAMIVAGPEGLRKNQYRKFNIRSETLTPGDDFGMMREVLTRRFKRLINEAPRPSMQTQRLEQGAEASAIDTPPASPFPLAGEGRGEGAGSNVTDEPHHPTPSSNSSPQGGGEQAAAPADDEGSPWPDLVLIDGGEGQLNAARETLGDLGITDVPLIGIAKGPDRDAGRETFHMPGRTPFRLAPRDPVLYFVQRLRDEAHRFAIGSHRQRRSRDIREAGLQEIAGIGPNS